MSESNDTTGHSKDAGWNVGVRKTVAAPVAEVWAYLLGKGLPMWLGDIDELPAKKGVRYRTNDGVRGTIRGFEEKKHVRLTWQPEDWPHDTALQLTVSKSAAGATIEISHEELADREERRMMLGHWHRVVDSLVAHFE
ncbi:SRPBCC domain-containing protein [Mycetocola sp.]|jgi:uncharacterized protein YndB with AHSA1/START domain|uniref:SRPBCC domain-containing protein n=1 Tax=Mycetocola sp. TaxID=1871042 RepID=UPI0026233C59|nr:SRPBCC domain-containing protein [Mycetocola sp.]MCU1560165.1 activator of Hsp90 ATPase 1 family protein [Mycetocola sp.]